MAKLLIVDDEKNIRNHLSTFFESCGHRVRTAESARQALEMLANEGEFDLVLSDYRMAEVNGLELLQRIKRERPRLPVILMTAYGTVENAVAAMKGGAYDYVAKPFTLEQIQHVVARALEVESLRAEVNLLRDAIQDQPLLDSRSPVDAPSPRSRTTGGGQRSNYPADGRERHRQERPGQTDPSMEPAFARPVRGG